jgi:hypothetical protein
MKIGKESSKLRNFTFFVAVLAPRPFQSVVTVLNPVHLAHLADTREHNGESISLRIVIPTQTVIVL